MARKPLPFGHGEGRAHRRQVEPVAPRHGPRMRATGSDIPLRVARIPGRVKTSAAAPHVAEISTPDAGTTPTVMAGLVPAIHDFCDINHLKSWMVGTRHVLGRAFGPTRGPTMTMKGELPAENPSTHPAVGGVS